MTDISAQLCYHFTETVHVRVVQPDWFNFSSGVSLLTVFKILVTNKAYSVASMVKMLDQ